MDTIKRLVIRLRPSFYNRLLAMAQDHHRSLQGEVVAALEAVIEAYEQTQRAKERQETADVCPDP